MKPSFLMCSPEYFGVRYTINPWMEGQIGQVDPAIAVRQWTKFYSALKRQADIHLIDPQSHVPDRKRGNSAFSSCFLNLASFLMI